MITLSLIMGTFLLSLVIFVNYTTKIIKDDSIIDDINEDG